MACLSVQSEGTSVFVVCVNPVFPLSDGRDGTFTFGVFDADSRSLRNRVGKIDAYTVDRIPPFFGELASLEPCRSSHSGLLLLRGKSTLRGTIKIHSYLQPDSLESSIPS
jgi:hypothetical protein